MHVCASVFRSCCMFLSGCEDILRVAESVAQFSINATTVKDVMNAKNGTEEFDKACK